MEKPSPFRYFLVLIPLALIILLAIFVRKEMANLAGLDQLTPAVIGTEVPGEEVKVDPGLQKAVDLAVDALKARDMGFVLYQAKIDHIEYLDDGNTASVWLASLDPDTGEVLAREPEIAIAKKNPEGQKGEASSWFITLPYDEEYDKAVKSIPEGSLGEDFQQRFQTKYVEPKVVAKFGGYYLPWGGGQKKRLTWSLSHKSCSGSACKYAFDFADGTMFPIQAAKGGSVFAYQIKCSNGSTNCTNYLILKDSSTNPISYQIYYHMAANTLPSAYRKIGALVNQGAYIGNVDDTGASTAHHLHFMVHTSSYGYWGQSVDITFKDVKINYDSVTKGGRPRMPNEATTYGGQGQVYYVSGNKAAKGPTGTISSPVAGAVITDRTMTISGTGKDDKGVTKVQLLMNYDNAWHDVGTPVTTASFKFNVDLCAASAQIPDGPIALAVRLWDVEGNQSVGYSGFTGVVKNYSCSDAPPPPVCNPASDEVALFSNPYYSGTCKVYKVGDYVNPASMKGFAGEDAASVLVGSNAQVTLWTKASYQSRAETLVLSDPDLADNLVNRDTVNSFKVKTHAQLALTPVIFMPTASAVITAQDSVTLGWWNGGWADEFQVELSGTNGFVTRTRDYAKTTSWQVGGLPAGTYTFKVRGRNSSTSSVSAWASGTFTVKAGAFTGTPINAPWQDDVESGVNGWTATGLWKQTTQRSSGGTHSWLYGETVNSVLQYTSQSAGTLTSPSIRIPGTGYYLHFVSRYNTEGLASYFDQRWVQVSVDGAPFQNLYQFFWDPESTWLLSPALDLSGFSGKTIRIRFSFNNVDSTLNVGDGWYIDSIAINQNGPASGCNEPNANNLITQAVQIAPNQTFTADICSAGDVDYYKITGKAGERLTFDVDAKTISSKLDSVLTLIYKDGKTVLAENDDEVAYQQKDPLLYYVLPNDGTYYLKIQAWDHPMVGGPDYFYNLKVYSDKADPTVSISYPTSGKLLPNAVFNITANAADSNGSGINHVNFFWHNSDWDAGVWQKIGEDWTATDGWSFAFDPTKEIKASSGAVFVQAFDGSGNWAGIASWGIKTDPNQAPPPLPSSAMVGGTITSGLTANQLVWSASDVGSGINHFEFQMQVDGGSWTSWLPEGVTSASRNTWFMGEPGKTYGFRMRVVDNSSKEEAWTTAAETTITIKSCSVAADAFEEDDTRATAKSVNVDGNHDSHSFCGLQDQDWLKFSAVAGEQYFINGLPNSKAVGVVLTIYNSAGNPIAEQFPDLIGNPTSLRWTAGTSGTYTVRARNLNPLIAGDDAKYQIWVDQGLQYYVPMVTGQ